MYDYIMYSSQKKQFQLACGLQTDDLQLEVDMPQKTSTKSSSIVVTAEINLTNTHGSLYIDAV